MGRLLGDELSERLEDAVASAFARVELQAALEALCQWRGCLDVPARLPDGEAVPDKPIIPAAARVAAGDSRVGADEGRVPPTDASPLTLGQVIRGNISVLCLGFGVGLYVVWKAYFEFPTNANVRLLGWEGIELRWLASLTTFILGSLGLSVLITAGNLVNLISHFYWPLESLEGEQMKRFFCRWGTAIFSVAVLALFAAVCNVTVRLRVEPPELDLVAVLGEGSDGFFVVKDARDGGEALQAGPLVRLGGPQSVRLALRGLRANAVLLLRDKYNLMTVDAIVVRRRFWRVDVENLQFDAPLPSYLSPAERGLLSLPNPSPRPREVSAADPLDRRV